MTVYSGPEPHLAHCDVCGATEPKPELPLDFKEFQAYLGRIMAKHRGCKTAAKP